MDRAASSLWSRVVGFTLAGVVLLWWAAEQLVAARLIFGSTFEFPAWRFLGWLVTLIAAGAMFGLAVGASRDRVSTTELRAAFVAGIVPLAAIVGFFTEWLYDWSPPGTLTILLRSQTTAAASCIIVGFLVASIVTHLASRSGETPDHEDPH